MASKTLHIVNHRIEVDQEDDPNTIFSSQVDLALALSKTLGRNIRQGQSFRVVGLKATLNHTSSDDADTGVAALVKVQYCPTNRHGVKGWQMAFNKWRKQKLLAGKVGQQVRYDDFEVAWASTYNTTRTSTLYAGGLGDTNTEKVCLYGSSASGVSSAIQDLYDSAHPIAEVSRDEFGVTIKEPKFTTAFPQPATLGLTAHMSANADWTQSVEVLGVEDATAGSVHYMGGSAGADYLTFGDDNHINVMTGVMLATVALLPPDIDSGPDPPTAETGWYVDLDIMVEGWSSLLKTPRRTSYRPRMSQKRSTRYNPWSGKRRYTRAAWRNYRKKN